MEHREESGAVMLRKNSQPTQVSATRVGEEGAVVNPWDRFILPVMRRFRRKRAAMLMRKYPDFEQMHVCDLGGSRHFWEASGLRPGSLVILNISDASTQSVSGEFANASIVLYDEYDLLLSNSVIEHVSPAKRASLCAEMRRVAKQIYLQTPAWEFPLEPHFAFPFLHWLPHTLGRMLVLISPFCLLSKPRRVDAWAYFDEINLLRRSELKALFPSATVEKETFALLPKSHLVFWVCPDTPAVEGRSAGFSESTNPGGASRPSAIPKNESS
jgi:hypothetical protein